MRVSLNCIDISLRSVLFAHSLSLIRLSVDARGSYAINATG